MDQSRLVVSIMQFLQGSLPSLSADSAESLQVSIDCLREVFKVDETNAALQTPMTLVEIFNKFAPAAVNTTSTTSNNSAQSLLDQITAEVPDDLRPSFVEYINILKSKGAFNDPSQYETILKISKQKFMESKVGNLKEAAEKLKMEGNTKLSSHDYQGALDCYTRAIAYDGTNAIYYANRSSAYSNLKKYQEASQDADEAIKRNPGYGKAYFRLGSAKVSLGEYQAAVDAYNKAIELEPTNDVYRSSLAAAESKLANPLAGIGGMPDLGGMDLGSLMNNPMLKNMAQNLFQDPQMRAMMENGNLQDMAKNVMSNPDMLQQMMGMLGKK
eukprot:gene15616-18556_t